MSVKVGIISEFSLNTVNYGNNLQAFALGYYLKKINPEYEIEYIVPKDRKVKRTSYLGVLFRKMWIILSNLFIHHRKEKQMQEIFLKNRLNAFAKFRDNYFESKPRLYNWKQLQKTVYDILIVGSDVVWEQERFIVNRFFFLDLKRKNKAKKVAYAASFGNDWVPAENKKYIQKCLHNFQMISVRENSSVDFLKEFGINNAIHVLDPTLLIENKIWESIEEKPLGSIGKVLEEDFMEQPFAFVYFLDASEDYWMEISRICSENGLVMVLIPYADGHANVYNLKYGDVQVTDCSPQEWIWLIHHASYVFTNSFHGVVFSTIFERKFIVARRMGVKDINNRLFDYLNTICQSDKMVNLKQISDLSQLLWDYTEIRFRLKMKKEASEDFLVRVCAKT